LDKLRKATDELAEKFTDVRSANPMLCMNHEELVKSVYDNFDVHMVFDGFGDHEISWSIIKNDEIVERGDFIKHGSLGAKMGQTARTFEIKAEHTADLAGKLMGLQSYGIFNKEFYDTLKHDIYQVNDLFNIKK